MRICYISGSRADFGLMRRCLEALDRSDRHELSVAVTGQHTASGHAVSMRDVRASGLAVAGEVPVRLTGDGGGEMAHALADELAGLTVLLARERPDLVLLLGDRGEMVAGALAAVHLGIHVAHIHGGERSGTLDESFRHAVSKLAHIHLPATRDAAERLRRMGEREDAIHVIGAPGLVGITRGVVADRSALAERHGLDPSRPLALVVFHPVVQRAAEAGAQFGALVAALRELGLQGIVFRPNSDAGGRGIEAVIEGLDADFRVVTHLERPDYLRALASADVMVGNSSSGIIESASFDTPCVNLGERQNNRLRNPNTVDCPHFATEAIAAAIMEARALSGPFENLYGDGTADRRLLDVLASLDLDRGLLSKCNTY